MEPTTTLSLADASLITGVGGLVLAIVFFVLWRRAAATPRASTVATVDSAVEPSEALVGSLIALADLSTSPAQRRQASRVLATVGVDRIEAGAGDVFDAEKHSAVDTEQTDDDALVGRIASVARDGWSRGDAVVRSAEVVVWVGGATARPVAQ